VYLGVFCVCFGWRRRQIKEISGGGGWVLVCLDFLCVYAAAAAAGQVRSAAVAARCGFLAVVVLGGGGGQSR
jgi:hypothetical protein